MIQEFKKRCRNTLFGKAGHILLEIIRRVRHKCMLVYYRIHPASYISQPKTINNNSGQQRKIWETTFNSSSSGEYKLKSSLLWGNLGDKNELESKYNELLTKILSYTSPQATVLELGAYDGMWTQYFLESKKIICVDLFESGFEYIQKRCQSDKIQFYRTQGNELHGVENNSVDLIFAVDSLVRASTNDISCYMQEFKRVLKPRGGGGTSLALY